jgi:hypothetical protein
MTFQRDVKFISVNEFGLRSYNIAINGNSKNRMFSKSAFAKVSVLLKI